jgi:hypothetical protein
MFPEGISRYHPQLAPFKAGVAMIASDVSEELNGKKVRYLPGTMICHSECLIFDRAMLLYIAQDI